MILESCFGNVNLDPKVNADVDLKVEILGDWVKSVTTIDQNVNFDVNGFAWTTNSFGLFPGQKNGDLSLQQKTDGNYDIHDDTLYLTVNRTTLWSSLTPNDKPTVIKYDLDFQIALIDILNNQLTLRYPKKKGTDSLTLQRGSR